MQFKIKKTTYHISFSFLILILLALTTEKTQSFIILLLFATLHEIVHLIFIYCLSLPPLKVSFTILGANIKRGQSVSNDINSEILINLSAPVFNIITGVIFYFISEEISTVNFLLGFFNLIQFYTFDGGTALKYIFLKFLSEKKTEQALTLISLIITIAFSFLSIYIFLNYQHNFSLIIMTIYMFVSIIFKKQNALDY